MSHIGTVKRIVVHCSDSDWGDAKAINQWHTAPPNNWDSIGYHKVILNGHRQSLRPYEAKDDGLVEDGRPLDVLGAHVGGKNTGSIGICVIGKRHFTGIQLFHSLPILLVELCTKFNINIADVFGHYELDSKKTCPNLQMIPVRDFYGSWLLQMAKTAIEERKWS